MKLASLLLLVPLAVGACEKEPDDTDTGAVVPATLCEQLELTERAWIAAEESTALYATAADLTLTTTEGELTLSELWSGCESFLFILDEPRQEAGNPTPLWDRDVAELFERLPPNVHLFFASIATDAPDRDAALSDLELAVDEALAAVDEDQAAWWRERVHYLPDRHADQPGWLGTTLRSPRWGMAIDRLQRLRFIGSFADYTRSNSSIGWFEGNLSMAASEPVYYNFEAVRDEELSATDATILPLWDDVALPDDTGSGGWSYVELTLPDAGAMAGFDTLELDLYLGCVGDGEFGDCPAWDYLVYLRLCEVADPDTCTTEVGRWITTYHREGRWVHDVSGLLPLLADGGTRRFAFYTSQTYETSLSIRLSNQGKAARPVTVVPLFRGGAFDATYNDKYVPIDVPIPSTATKVELATVISGHGQVGSANCAEFCDTTHRFEVGGNLVMRNFPEVGDYEGCLAQVSEGTVPNQYGTWWYGRSGWCPGKEVPLVVEDVTAHITPGQTATLTYEAFKGGQPYTVGGARIELESWLVISE